MIRVPHRHHARRGHRIGVLLLTADLEAAAGLRSLLDHDSRFRFVGTATGVDALEAAEEIHPDLVLVDERQDRFVARAMDVAAPEARVVELSALPLLRTKGRSDPTGETEWLEALSGYALLGRPQAGAG